MHPPVHIYINTIPLLLFLYCIAYTTLHLPVLYLSVHYVSIPTFLYTHLSRTIPAKAPAPPYFSLIITSSHRNYTLTHPNTYISDPPHVLCSSLTPRYLHVLRHTPYHPSCSLHHHPIPRSIPATFLFIDKLLHNSIHLVSLLNILFSVFIPQTQCNDLISLPLPLPPQHSFAACKPHRKLRLPVRQLRHNFMSQSELTPLSFSFFRKFLPTLKIKQKYNSLSGCIIKSHIFPTCIKNKI